MQIDAKTVMELRRATSAGMMDCKKALIEADGDLDKARDILRAKLGKQAEKKSGRATKNGTVAAYVHHNGKLGTMVELLCETDFVAMNDRFREFARDLCKHVAAAETRPKYLTRDEVPDDDVAREKAIFMQQMTEDPKMANKPEQIREKIVEGKLDAYFKTLVLLDQPYAMNPEHGTVQGALDWAKSKSGFGENCKIRRFAIFDIDEAVGPSAE